MIKITQSFDVKSSVNAIFADDNTIHFTDCEGNLHTINKYSYAKVSKPLVQNMQEPLHKYQKGVSFSQNGYIGYSVDKQKSCALCLKLPHLDFTADIEDLSNEALLFYGNDQKAEVITFCGDNGEYFFTGGNDGRVYMYSTNNAKVLMSLKPKPEYISSISVDKNGTLLAYSAFDKSLTILNIRYQKEQLSTFLGDVIEHSFFYGDSKFFYAVGRDGNSYTYDLKSKITSKKALFVSWPTCAITDSSERFAIVGTRSEMLYIIKLSDNSMFSSFKLDQKGVSSLYIEGNNLYIGFENGWVYMVDMHAYIDDFSQSLTIKDFKRAKKCLDKNIFLTIHPMSEMFEEAWEDVLKDIINQFSTGNINLAFESAEAFLSDEKHKKEFASLLQKQKEFEKFSLKVQNKELQEACNMLECSPYLSNTDSARKLELYFSKSFAQAKKMISQDPLRNISNAKELLNPFMQVPAKKDMIFSLFKDYEIYLKADSLINERKFKEYFLLTQKFEFLTKQELYKKVCTLAESSISKIQNMLNKDEYEIALQGIKQTLVFLPYKEQITQMLKEIQLKQKLSQLIKDSNINLIYELVAIHPSLEQSYKFMEFDKKFDEHMHRAMSFIADGEIKKVQLILSPYEQVTIFKPKIKECARQATLNKLNILFERNCFAEAELLVSSFIKNYPKDKEYEKLLKQYALENNPNFTK